MEEFLTVYEVAPRVKMSVQALYTAIREKQFPAVKIGSRIRIPVSRLDKWVESQVGGGDGGQDSLEGGDE